MESTARQDAGALRLRDGKLVLIPACGLLIGRMRSCDLVLDDADASRRHALLRVFGGEVWVLDQGSTNGTLLDGNLVTRARLDEGGELTVGATRMHWTADTEGAAWPELLEEQWERFRTALDDGDTEREVAEALRELADAEVAKVGADGAVTLAWADGEPGLDGLGPLRRELVEDALALLCR